MDWQTLAAPLSLGAYAACSIAIMTLNKVLFTGYEFPSPLFALVVQFAITVAVMGTLKAVKRLRLAPVTMPTIKAVAPVSLIFVSQIYVGLMAVSRVNLPTLTALARLGILFSMVMEGWAFGKKASPSVRNSVLAMVAAGFIAAATDLQFDVIGYMYTLAKTLLTAGYQVGTTVLLKKVTIVDDSPAGGPSKGERRSGDANNNGISSNRESRGASDHDGGERRRQLSKNDLMFYNSLICLPVLCLYFLFINPLQLVETTEFMFAPQRTMGFYVTFTFVTIMGLLMNYSVFLAVSNSSATSLAVVGCAKNVVVAYIGMGGVGGDYVFSWNNFLSQNLSIGASIAYAYYKNKEKEASSSRARENGQQYSKVRMEEMEKGGKKTKKKGGGGASNGGKGNSDSFYSSVPSLDEIGGVGEEEEE